MYISISSTQYPLLIKALAEEHKKKAPVVLFFKATDDDNFEIKTADAYIVFVREGDRLFASVGARLSLAAFIASDDQIILFVAGQLFVLISELPPMPVPTPLPTEPPYEHPEETGYLAIALNATTDTIVELKEKSTKAIIGSLFKIGDELMKVEVVEHHNKFKVRRAALGSKLAAHAAGAKVSIFKDTTVLEPRPTPAEKEKIEADRKSIEADEKKELEDKKKLEQDLKAEHKPTPVTHKP